MENPINKQYTGYIAHHFEEHDEILGHCASLCPALSTLCTQSAHLSHGGSLGYQNSDGTAVTLHSIF